MKEGWSFWKIVGVLLAAYLGWRIVTYVAITAVKIAVPILIAGGVIYVIYRASGGKALSGGRRSLP